MLKWEREDSGADWSLGVQLRTGDVESIEGFWETERGGVVMKETDKFRLCMMVFAVCCLTVCTILQIQIAIQEKQLQMGEYMRERIEELEGEVENIACAEHENEALSQKANQIANDVQHFLRQYNITNYEALSRQKEMDALKSEYDKRLYLDRIFLQLGEENGSGGYMERYFQIEKGSLKDFLNGLQWEEELGAHFYEMEKWGELLPVGERVWNLYAPDSSPDSVPIGVLLQNPLIDFGYKEARTGMKLLDIQERYPEAGKEDEKLADGNFLYLQYGDERYRYYYVTIDYGSGCTMLYVTHR